MGKHIALALVTGVIGSLLLTPTASRAQSVYTEGHADIGLVYEDGTLVPHWHLEAGDVVNGEDLAEETEYAPGELVAQFSGTRSAASGADQYLGVPAGTQIYMGGPSVAWQPYLGLGTEELTPSDWNGPLTIRLSGWTTPGGGAFALYTTNASGSSTTDIFLSTYNPSAANIDGIGQNAFYMFPGGHEHYTFGFTTPGDYTITLEFSGTNVADGFKSASATFGFTVVPEPAAHWLLLGAALGGLLIFRRRQLASVAGR